MNRFIGKIEDSRHRSWRFRLDRLRTGLVDMRTAAKEEVLIQLNGLAQVRSISLEERFWLKFFSPRLPMFSKVDWHWTRTPLKLLWTIRRNRSQWKMILPIPLSFSNIPPLQCYDFPRVKTMMLINTKNSIQFPSVIDSKHESCSSNKQDRERKSFAPSHRRLINILTTACGIIEMFSLI